VLAFTVTGTDPDGDPLTYSMSNAPGGASLVNQIFRWQPSYDEVGNYNVTFTLQDDQSPPLSDTEDCQIRVVYSTPRVIATVPARDAIGVNPNISTITATFSRDMDPMTIGQAFSVEYFNGEGFTSVSGEVSYSNRVAIFTILSPGLPWGSVIRASISEFAADMRGVGIASDYSWEFSTEED
jgi:hypothetical protein